MTDNAYTKKQVLKIEDLLLQTLHFEVSTVTTHTFLLHYLKLAEVDEVTEDLARVRHRRGILSLDNRSNTSRRNSIVHLTFDDM